MADALGSVRQIVDANGNVTLAKSYEPYGTVLTSTGTASSIFGYAGEQLDTTGLIYLRARYMNPRLGIFLAHDPWDGDMLRPGSMNGFNYVEGNPILFIDPSGEILDPSEPTFRGTIIHFMIEAQYADVFTILGAAEPNVPVPMGTKRGLRRIRTQYGDLWGTDNETLATGFADIVDHDEHGLYEIKPRNAAVLGQITVGWYISAWNLAAQQNGGREYLQPGLRYPGAPGVIVGTDPNNSRKWIKAELAFPGVILYKAEYKSRHSPDPIPFFVYEWNPNEQKVNKRNQEDAGKPFPIPAPASTSVIGAVCVIVVVVGGTVVILIDPVPGDEAGLPVLWGAGAKVLAGAQ